MQAVVITMDSISTSTEQFATLVTMSTVRIGEHVNIQLPIPYQLFLLEHFCNRSCLRFLFVAIAILQCSFEGIAVARSCYLGLFSESCGSDSCQPPRMLKPQTSSHGRGAKLPPSPAGQPKTLLQCDLGLYFCCYLGFITTSLRTLG